MALFSWFKSKKRDQVYSPAAGTLASLETLNDGVFSEKMLGDGFVVTNTNGMVYAPVSGKLVTLFPTQHAYGIETKSGLNILVHIGIDTVNLKGEGFTTNLVQGQMVHQGDLLAKVDLDVLAKANLNPSIVVVITKESQLQPGSIRTEGQVTLQDVIIEEFKAV